MKCYYYKLYGNYLCYFLKEDDLKYKGYIKLHRDVLLEKKQLISKKENIFYLEFSKHNNMRKLYSKESEIVKQWYNALKS